MAASCREGTSSFLLGCGTHPGVKRSDGSILLSRWKCEHRGSVSNTQGYYVDEDVWKAAAAYTIWILPLAAHFRYLLFRIVRQHNAQGEIIQWRIKSIQVQRHHSGGGGE